MTDPAKENGVRWWLAKWGSYLRIHSVEYLGYPRKCTFIDGPGVIRSTNNNDTIPEHVEKIERIVNSSSFNETYRFVLKCRYVRGLTGTQAQIDHGIDKRKFNRLASRAEIEVSKRMES